MAVLYEGRFTYCLTIDEWTQHPKRPNCFFNATAGPFINPIWRETLLTKWKFRAGVIHYRVFVQGNFPIVKHVGVQFLVTSLLLTRNFALTLFIGNFPWTKIVLWMTPVHHFYNIREVCRIVMIFLAAALLHTSNTMWLVNDPHILLPYNLLDRICWIFFSRRKNILFVQCTLWTLCFEDFNQKIHI